MKSNRILVFLCSGAEKSSAKKLSFRIASYLQDIGLGEIGSLTTLSEQHTTSPGLRRKMVFINDCNSSCVKLLTHPFDPTEYLYIDVTPYKHSVEFNIQEFVKNEILSKFSNFGIRVEDSDYS